MSVRYLSSLELVHLNQQICRQTGHPCGLLSLEALQAALERPAVSIDGYEPFPGLFEKAAVMLESLIQTAPFLSDNQATAFLAADVMLRLNGQSPGAAPDDSEQLASIALQQLTIPQIAEWLRQKSQPAL
ncbi:MAG: hypothetical protein IGS03_12905 [Candidatus Sericytochromatia bacterium]|nr:hypothetical protein [Candidatus Sericytochromatia bacterium]